MPSSHLENHSQLRKTQRGYAKLFWTSIRSLPACVGVPVLMVPGHRASFRKLPSPLCSSSTDVCNRPLLESKTEQILVDESTVQASPFEYSQSVQRMHALLHRQQAQERAQKKEREGTFSQTGTFT